jgi:U3 small nucleolar RNA-associated protein 22
MNYRYFHKRAHYLAVIKAALEEAASADEELKGMDISWSGDDRRPIIILKAGKGEIAR